MSVTPEDFKNGKLLYQGPLEERFHFDGREILKLKTGEFFIRKDGHILPNAGFFPNIEIYDIGGKKVLIYLTNDYCTFIEAIKVIESETIYPFDGFEPDKQYELKNGQIWQQIGGPYAPYQSAGNVKIINDQQIKVDNLSFFPIVKLLN